jgi:hypothetical protein
MSRFLRVAAVLTLSLASLEAKATIVVPMTIEQMAAESACVTRGRVVSQQAAWDEAHRRIYTYTEIQVLERIHSKGSVPDTVVVRTLGGEVGEIGMKVSGTPKFEVGEEVVVFLRHDPVDEHQFQVVGMSQGKFAVERADKGAIYAVPSVEGLAFARPSAEGKMMVDETTDASRISLGVMKDRVQAATRVSIQPSNQ